MPRELDPRRTDRSLAFSLWMQAPMPMVTLFKTLDVTAACRAARRHGYKFNMLLCWAIGRAAARTPAFYRLPVGQALMEYDRLAVSVVVATADGGIATCDIPVSDSLAVFQQDYLARTGQVARTGQALALDDESMVIGTSALARYDIDGAVNLYAGVYNNPFLIWGRYRRGPLRTRLPISFQFHHTQMDGIPAARFLEDLQAELRRL